MLDDTNYLSRVSPTEAELDAASTITPEDVDAAIRAFDEHAPRDGRGLLDAETEDANGD